MQDLLVIKGIKPQGKPWTAATPLVPLATQRGFKPFEVVAKMPLQASIFASIIKTLTLIFQFSFFNFQ